MAANPGDLPLSSVPIASPSLRLVVGEDRLIKAGNARGGEGEECVPSEDEDKDDEEFMVARALMLLLEPDAGRRPLPRSKDDPSDMLDPKERSVNSAGRSSCRRVGEIGCSNMSKRAAGLGGEERSVAIVALIMTGNLAG